MTLVANAVNLEHPAITRARASDLDETSDLGDRLVTTGVGPLPAALVAKALARGVDRASDMVREEKIYGAVLILQRQARVAGTIGSRVASRYQDTQRRCAAAPG